MVLLKVILDHQVMVAYSETINGQILHIFYGYLGINSNNVAELWALIKGLQITHQNQFHQLIVEGDSQLIIHMLTKLQWGSFHPSYPPIGDWKP
jgi:ribonuclease HI